MHMVSVYMCVWCAHTNTCHSSSVVRRQRAVVHLFHSVDLGCQTQSGSNPDLLADVWDICGLLTTGWTMTSKAIILFSMNFDI